VAELRGDTAVGDQARVVNSFDALLGVHGAGLTNAAFVPPGGVLIQVVPYGKMEFIARAEFSEPATDMGLKYLDYSVAAEESTLLDVLGPEHPVFKGPGLRAPQRMGHDRRVLSPDKGHPHLTSLASRLPNLQILLH
jgi:hypothetical protein